MCTILSPGRRELTPQWNPGWTLALTGRCHWKSNAMLSISGLFRPLTQRKGQDVPKTREGMFHLTQLSGQWKLPPTLSLSLAEHDSDYVWFELLLEAGWAEVRLLRGTHAYLQFYWKYIFHRLYSIVLSPPIPSISSQPSLPPNSMLLLIL